MDEEEEEELSRRAVGGEGWVINCASLRELSGQQTVIEVMVQHTITKDSS